MTKQYLNDNEIEYEFVYVDLLDPESKDKAHQIITSKGGMLTYPTTIIDDKIVISGFRKDLLKEALGI